MQFPVLALVVTRIAAYSFESYSHDFQKNFANEDERQARRMLFEQRLQNIIAHNLLNSSNYSKGVNHMTDWTEAEFARAMGRRDSTQSTSHQPLAPPGSHQPLEGRLRRSPSDPLPAAVDWRACSPWADSPLCPLATRPASPITTSVKNQGHCGSCWAFGSTATLEAHFSLATGRSEALSPQHLVSCAPNPGDCGGTGGCQGSTADVAYGWLAKSGGLASAYTYGYASGLNGSTGVCDQARTTPLATVGGIGKPTSNDYQALMEAVASVGPIAVNVYASTWRDYAGGIFDGCKYSGGLPINHVVVLEGYGTDSATGLDYWLIRNSWSTAFGEKGYIRLLREPKPVCGTDTQPGSGWDCAPYPKSVMVCGMCGVAYEPTYPTGVGVSGP